MTVLTDTATLARKIDLQHAAICLDFDGTLIELAATPDAIAVPDDLIETLNALRDAVAGRLAVITGRSDGDVVTYLAGFQGAIYASHGGCLHIDGTRQDIVAMPRNLAALTADARAFCDARPALKCEEKSMGFALHFRQQPALEQRVRDYVEGVVDGADDLQIQTAKMAFEVKAKGVNKGAAVRDAITRFGWQQSTLWMFGDDTTDEVAFDAVHAHGGHGVKVGQGASAARYRLQNPQQVRDVLTQLEASRHD